MLPLALQRVELCRVYGAHQSLQTQAAEDTAPADGLQRRRAPGLMLEEEDQREPEEPVGHPMAPTWVWMQIAIIVFVVAGMIIAVTKLA